MKVSDLWIGKRLLVGLGAPETLGRGTREIRGSGYVEGPLQVGKCDEFNEENDGEPSATVMIGPEKNTDRTQHPGWSLQVKGDVRIDSNSEGQTGDLRVADDVTVGDNIHADNNITLGNRLTATREVYGYDCIATKNGKMLSTRKAFDISHPTKEGYRLRHICLEGPESAVYIRGRVKNTNEIVLPSYWKDLVHERSITVQLQPIGSHQDVIIKRWDSEKVYLQSNASMPIDCFYHIFGERKDGEKLIVEYQGESPADYPGDNSAYSVNK